MAKPSTKRLMSITEFARLVGRDRATVSRWVDLFVATCDDDDPQLLPPPATGVWVDPESGRRLVTL